MKSVIFTILIILLSLGLNTRLDASPYRARFYSTKDLKKLDLGESAVVSFKTHEGFERIKLIAVKPPLVGTSEVSTFHGYSLKSPKGISRNELVSASIYQNKLHINFYGNRKRLFELSLNLDSNNNSAKLRHIYSKKFILCGSNQVPVADFAKEDSFKPETVYSPNLVLQLGTDADHEFYQANSSSLADTKAKIVSIINTVNAVYLAQLGISVEIVVQNVFRKSSQPYTETDASRLLDSFAAFTRQNKQIVGDVKHLFTGKLITVRGSPGVAGIAYTGVTCQRPGLSFSISQRSHNSIQAIVTAHEIAHNLGARHDDVTGGIMESVVAPANTEFSNQSISELMTYVDNFGSCLLDQEPVPSLGLRFNRQGNFRISSRALAASASNCLVGFYGAKSEAALEASQIEAATFLGSAPGTREGSRTRLVARDLDIRSKRKLYFRSQVICGNYTVLSEIKDDSKL